MTNTNPLADIIAVAQANRDALNIAYVEARDDDFVVVGVVTVNDLKIPVVLSNDVRGQAFVALSVAPAQSFVVMKPKAVTAYIDDSKHRMDLAGVKLMSSRQLKSVINDLIGECDEALAMMKAVVPA